MFECLALNSLWLSFSRRTRVFFFEGNVGVGKTECMHGVAKNWALLWKNIFGICLIFLPCAKKPKKFRLFWFFQKLTKSLKLGENPEFLSQRNARDKKRKPS